MIRIKEKTKVDGEKEGMEILHNVQLALGELDQIFFFFFFVKNSTIFHSNHVELFIENLLLKNRFEFEETVDLDMSEINDSLVDQKILEIWKNYIDNNKGTCANYFSITTVQLIKSYLEEHRGYENVKREAKICKGHTPIHTGHLDLVAKKMPRYDLFECKHAIYPQRDKIESQCQRLNDIVSDLLKLKYESQAFLATIEFIKKDLIENIIRKVPVLDIINGEDVFGVAIRD